jgi:two-component system, NtrC family, sensor kinase
MSATRDSMLADPEQLMADLQRQLAQCGAERDEALQRETATAEVLQVINSSPGDLTPVFDAMLEKAMRLCEAAFGFLMIYDGDRFHPRTQRGVPPALAEYLAAGPDRPGPGEAHTRVLAGEELIHSADFQDEEPYRLGAPLRRAVVDLGGARTALVIALRRDNLLLGTFTIYRQEVRPFTDKQIALLQSFAAQAVIAMENARLLSELRERSSELALRESDLREINDRYGLVIQAAAEGIYDWDISQNRLWVSSRLIELFGWGEPDSGAGERPSQDWNARVHPEDFPSYRAALRATLKDQTARLHCEYRIRLSNGDYRWVEDHAVPVRDERGWAVRLVGAVSDITDRKQGEKELREALEQQTATAEVLQVINSSPGDLAPVFQTMLQKAHTLCEAAFGALMTFDGERFHPMAHQGTPAPFKEMLAPGFPPGAGDPFARMVEGAALSHIHDMSQVAERYRDEPLPRAAVDLGGVRTFLVVPLRKDDALLGVITAYRQEVRPFSDKQIALLHNFAAQAVIAMENARLITETREALEQQTASAEVLQVINSSPGDLAPVFGAMLQKALQLCDAAFGALWTYDGGRFHAATVHNVPAALAEFVTKPYAPGPHSPLGRIVGTRKLLAIPDLATDAMYLSGDRGSAAPVELGGARSYVAVPLLTDEALVGAITVYRREVRPFTDKQIALLQNFAAQAVIAMENARLITETREALEQQTATAEVLQVINSSPGDLKPVFQALLDKALALCGAAFGVLWTYDGDYLHAAALHGVPAPFAEFLTQAPHPVGSHNAHGRLFGGESMVHIVDLEADEAHRSGDPIRRALVELGGGRVLLAVPLRKDNAFLGVLTIYRQEPRAFSDKQIALLQNFAAQAVIAMENARLIDEIRQRQAELRVTFDNMGDGVVMFDEDLRLTAWNRNFQELLDLPDTVLVSRPSYAEYLRILADRGEFGSADVEGELQRGLAETERELRVERTRPDGRVIEVRRNAVPGGGFVLIYSDITERKEAEARLRAARDTAEGALRELRAAQANLIHAEKMASLGQLTAGIAHEIKNPLNFVNNFAGLSVELLDELKEAAGPAVASLGDDQRGEIDELVATLSGNLGKIAEHGRRADGIVTSMLLHSRGGSGERRPADLNALVDEALNLAYHGVRARDQGFDIVLERDFDRKARPIELVPQEMTRVLLNLIGNGFYAASMKHRAARYGEPAVLRVTTRDLDETVEIRVRDNGCGIAPEISDKLFQPFFTTKPTGEGTGLGLSISWDIVTQQHGGTIEVDSRVGEYTEFTVRLPRSFGAAPNEKLAFS